jgi:hypothetical protein
MPHLGQLKIIFAAEEKRQIEPGKASRRRLPIGQIKNPHFWGLLKRGKGGGGRSVETKQGDVPHRRTRKNGKHKIWDEQISQVCGLFGCSKDLHFANQIELRSLWEISGMVKSTDFMRVLEGLSDENKGVCRVSQRLRILWYVESEYQR